MRRHTPAAGRVAVATRGRGRGRFDSGASNFSQDGRRRTQPSWIAIEVRRGLVSFVGLAERRPRRPGRQHRWSATAGHAHGGCRCLIRVLLGRGRRTWSDRRARERSARARRLARRPVDGHDLRWHVEASTVGHHRASPRRPWRRGRSAYARGLPIDVRSMWTASKSTAFHCSVLPVASAL